MAKVTFDDPLKHCGDTVISIQNVQYFDSTTNECYFSLINHSYLGEFVRYCQIW